MRLSFRYQFLLAPTAIILLLAGLVAYTLVELPRINRENDIPRLLELTHDRVLIMIATANLLDQLTQRMIANPGKRDELLFDYIEQAQIYLDHAQHPNILMYASDDIQHMITTSVGQLRDPEQVDPKVAHAALLTVMPSLKKLSVAIQLQRRSTFINYRYSLRTIVSRLINASLSVLVICIVLGIGLSIWGFITTRCRLAELTQRAHQVCAGNLSPYPAPTQVRDELDQIDQCLATMTQRLIDTVTLDKILQGAEDERRRIAMDMHDGVLADLTMLTRTLDLDSSHEKLPPISELRANMAVLAESIRRVIEDLHPQSLEILGLEAALRSFLQRHGSGPNSPAYHFEFDSNAESTLQPTQKIHLFRIASEAIHNVIQHAQCSRFEVSIRVVGQRLICTVEDNGIGMPTTQKTQGHGCLNITERARTIGAQTSWSPSRFSSGTRFELSLPLIATQCPA